MTQRQRKFIGVFLVLAVLVAYAVVAVTLADLVLPGMPVWLKVICYAVAGVGWVFPAGYLIAWMQRPDADET